MANRIKHRACFTKGRKSNKLKKADKRNRQIIRAIKRNQIV